MLKTAAQDVGAFVRWNNDRKRGIGHLLYCTLIVRMRTLFIDLASHSTLSHEGACIACVEDSHTKAIHFIDERIGDDGLMPAVDHILAAAGWDYKDLSHIACIVGPGGFTSLRMAVSLANALANQLKIPVAGIHLSDLYAARAEEGSYVWLHSTKRVQMFVRGFGDQQKTFSEPSLINADELGEKLNGAHWCGELIPEHQKIAEENGTKRMQIMSVADALPALLNKAAYSNELLLPWYGRVW
jgi:tRNA threonylcarbamoyl adenosine modification protein YeaZ